MTTENLQLIDTSQFDIPTLVKWYIDLRAHKSDLEASIKPAVEHTKQQMQMIETELTKRMNETETESMRTVNGTVSKVSKTKYSVIDPFLFRQWMVKNPEVAAQIANGQITQGEVATYIADGGTLPDGMAIDNILSISVRRA